MHLKSEKSVKLASIAVGFSSMLCQIVLLREFLVVFYGNELLI